MFLSRKVRWFICLCFLFYIGAKTANALTDGFFVWKISYQNLPESQWEVRALADSQRKEVNGILDQPFIYLGKGHHVFAFASADGEYVLKFLKRNPSSLNSWLDTFPLPASLNALRKHKLDEKRERLHTIFTGWKTGYEDLSLETGVLVVSMNRQSGFKQPVTLIDRMGLSHSVQLDETAFVLQKRVDVLADVLTNYIDNQKNDEAKQLLSRLIALYQSEYDRGFAEQDRYILRNTGVTKEGRPVHIDIGRLVRLDKPIGDYPQELMDKTRDLSTWLFTKDPSLATYLNEVIWNAKPSLKM